MLRLSGPRTWLCLLATLGIGSTLWAEDVDPEDWIPPAARENPKYDWMQLTSGEWLKGEFSHMYEDSVVFDSDILGELTIGWGGVKRVRFRNPMGVRLDDRTVHYDTIRMLDGDITLESSEETVPKSQVVSITPVYKTEWSRWKLEGKVAFDFQSGNTDETRYTTTLSATRRTVSTRFNGDYIGNYTKTDGDETANNHRASSNFDYFFDERLFIRAIDAEYYRDRFQNINTQVTVGAGVGYKFIDTSKLDWEIQFGPAYQYTEFAQVPAGSDRTVSSPAIVLSSTLGWDITADLDYTLNYQGTLTNRESGLYSQHIVSSLDYELTSVFDVFLMLQLDRVEEPQQRADGSTPRKNDLTVSVGLGIDI
ncbi:DUF481 domain-containing protein [Puniceicoccus vermicola]|uniref:DUF481 domain-containing protein n=1 Tax=Puniceicoccus vermicola TaxID=388746 RepID=A0A7X1E580_9BACT|nr:DUF481 domain-containing protein [Puniceicoccus vermicola]